MTLILTGIIIIVGIIIMAIISYHAVEHQTLHGNGKIVISIALVLIILTIMVIGVVAINKYMGG